MPADDLVLNVRQIAGYPPATSAPTSSALLLQLAGLGSAYASISPGDLVGTALSTGGDMAIGGALTANSVAGGSAQFSNAAFGMLTAQKACIVNFAAMIGTLGGVPIATTLDVAASVTSFNMRAGAVNLWLEDILCAGGAPIYSPRFLGNPRAMTPCPESNSTRLATTAYVTNAVGTAFAGYALLDSPNFIGNPTAPTAAPGSSTAQLATTAFVMTAVADSTTGVASFNGRSGLVVLTAADLTGAGGALLNTPTFTGLPAAPTAAPGTNTAQLATCAFVMNEVAAATAGVATFNGRTGNVQLTDVDVAAVGVSAFNNRIGSVTLIANDISAAGGAVLASPAFTGTPTAPTAAPGTNTSQLATTAFVMALIATVGGVTTFNGRAGAVTLTLADVTTALPGSTSNPLMNGTAAPGSSVAWSKGDHVHPTDTSRAAQAALASYLPLAGGTLTGNLNGTTIALTGNLSAPGANFSTNLISAAHTVNGILTLTTGPTSIIANANSTYLQINGGTAPAQGANLVLSSGGLSGLAIEFDWAGGVMGTFDTASNFTVNAGASKPGGGAWSASSDARIKDVQSEYALGLAEVVQLNPVVYTYRGNDTPTADGQSTHKIAAEAGTAFVGLIAQEVEAIFPGMVTKGAGWIDGVSVSDLRQLDTTELLFALVNAVKTLAARVATLEAA